MLPPSTEPSIYASEAPRGAEGPPGWHNRPPIVLSVELPLESPPSSDGELIIYLENVRACAVIAHTALTTLMPEEEIGRLKANEVRCLAAALWSLCAVKDMARLDWASERMEIQGFMRRAYERNVADAERFQKEACKGRTWTPRLFEWASRASLRWDTFDWRAPTPREG